MISKFKFNMVNIEGGNCAKKFHINKNKKKNENQTTNGRNIHYLVGSSYQHFLIFIRNKDDNIHK